MAANWTKGVTNNAQKWLNKYLNPRAAFNANPTQAQAAWQSGITRAISLGTYATKLGAADLTMAANNASTFGVQNYGTSGTTKAAKYAAKTGALASALSTVRATVLAMPNTTLQDRLARMTAMATGMAAYKGKI
jgi:cytosine/adenosine deaminase-related metal-dependent hydrolase